MRALRSQFPWLAMISLFVAMLVTWCLTAAPVMADAAMPFGKGRLFEVSKAGAPPNYVFGTMHVADKDVLRLPPPIARAFKGSRLLLVENDGDPNEMIKVLQAAAMPEGRKLEDVIKPDLYDQVITAAEAVGMKEAEVNRLRPWVLWFLLGDPRDQNIRRVTGQPVLDDALKQYAGKRGVPIVPLDRGDEIAAMFTVHLSDADQALMLEGMLLDPVPLSERHDAVRSAYLEGNLEALMALVRPGDSTLTEEERAFAARFDHQLLTSRNQRWIPRMTRHLKSGGVFVAVGAAHLPGETGILRLLEKAGYSVTRVL